MKKFIIIPITFFLLSCTLSAQDINPYLVDSQILPKPLMPAEFNGTGVVSFIVGNSGSDDMDLVANQEMKLTITLSYGVPDAANPLDAIGGTWADNFDWSYNSGDNTFHATQNQDIPSQLGGVSGTITILYKVTQNSKISNMNNGFAINIVPPAYAIYNNPNDDSASDFTNVEAFDYGDAPSSYGDAVHQINIYKSSGSYENYMYLGSSVDPETNSLNSVYTDATGDDVNDSDNDAISGEDDEDGVDFSSITLTPGATVTIPVQVTLEDEPVNDVYLTAWIDWNGDGVFAEDGPEQITYYNVFVPGFGWITGYSMLVSDSGVQNLQVTVPNDAVVGTTYARFRVGANNLDADGFAGYGEVEDYQITIDSPAGEVTGHLYIDVNGNGTQDAGEPDLADVDVVVTDSTNGIYTVASDSAGDWSATVYPGATTVNVDESDPDFPAGCSQTEGSDPTTITAVNGSSVDAGVDGYFIPVCIGDCVWLDDNGDGVHDPGEPGISNVVVHLLDDSSELVDQTMTDENGEYLFSNLPPATYQVEIVAPSPYVFTVQHCDLATDETDSDVDPESGLSEKETIALYETNKIVNAGVYIPADLFGYLFMDEDESLVRDAGDNVISNAAVELFVNGTPAGSTNTDDMGYYVFEDIPVGSVSVLVSIVDATLVAVPDSGEAATDERRNRALPGDGDTAYIDYAITSGYGVLDTLQGEPLNFGFSQHPLSTQISLIVYAVSDGRVMMEISTVNENGKDDIVVYAEINGEWFEVAYVPSEEIAGFGSNTYITETDNLIPGASYVFKVVDESGHIFESDLIAVACSRVAVESVTLTPEMIKVRFATEYGMFYQVMVCEELGVPWVVEYVQYPTASGWSDLNNDPFMAGPGDVTEVLIPRNNRPKAFFKIVKGNN